MADDATQTASMAATRRINTSPDTGTPHPLRVLICCNRSRSGAGYFLRSMRFAHVSAEGDSRTPDERPF